VGELKNEKIDIVRYSLDPVEYIVNALSPARVVSVDIMADDEENHEALVVVPDDQLSLAIGREGQNVRLAHKLTDWKIDIKSVSQMERAEAEAQDYNNEPQYDEESETEETFESDELQQEIEEEMNQQAYDEEDLQQAEETEEVADEDATEE
jgi:N utilization substance protein A